MNAPQREQTIFAEALRLPPEERAAYLDEAGLALTATVEDKR